MDGSAQHKMKTRFVFAALALLAFATLMAGAVFYRVVLFGDEPVTGFAPVFLWQLLAWLPWIPVFAALALPFGAPVQRKIAGWNIPAHIVAAIVLAFLHTLWFKTLSENISPFLGLEDTRYGVFRWFFIFWFFLGLFLYWASVAFFSLAGARGDAAPAPARRLVVKTGKVSEVVRPEDVFWIEAQDYYSVLHLPGKASWIKMTMKELERTLDPATFVRVHRSTIINVNFLKQLEKGNTGKYAAVMKDGARRPISRQGWRLLKPLLKAASP